MVRYLPTATASLKSSADAGNEAESKTNSDDFSEHSDNSVKAKNFVLSNTEVKISESVNKPHHFEEKMILPSSKIQEINDRGRFKEDNVYIIEQIHSKLSGHIYTKMGILLKIKEQDSSQSTKMKLLNNKESPWSMKTAMKCVNKCTNINSREQQVVELWNVIEGERIAFILQKTNTTGAHIPNCGYKYEGISNDTRKN